MSKIFISRPLKKNSPFRAMLQESGMEIIGQSLLQFSPILFKDIPPAEWVFFYSKKGVDFFMEQVQQSLIFQKKVSTLKWAVMGKGTAAALSKYKYKANFVGTGHPSNTATQFSSIAAKQKVLFIRAQHSQKSIQKLLNKQITSIDLVVYDNRIIRNFQLPHCDYLVFTSPLNAVAYYQKYAIDKSQKVIAIGNTTAIALNELGVKEVVIANKPTEVEMAKKVVGSRQFAVGSRQAVSSIQQQNIHSMAKKYAVIDLGTNTFHLLVAQKLTNESFKEIHRQRFYVKLAESGIETIGAAALERGFHALKTFRETLDQLEITKVKAIGTAALRTASNGGAFIQAVKEKYDIDIKLIDGNREAELIYKGTILAIPFSAKNHLIMDIGGGSVEFIIANQKTILWAQSFPIGVAVLFKKFHHSDPITALEVNNLETFLNNSLTPLYEALQQFPCTTLVGASGTFDVLEFILAKDQSTKNHAFVAVKDFAPLYQTLLQSTESERYKMAEVPDTRADMIVVAMILIDFILDKVGITEIIVSNFALKEGVLSELIE